VFDLLRAVLLGRLIFGARACAPLFFFFDSGVGCSLLLPNLLQPPGSSGLRFRTDRDGSSEGIFVLFLGRVFFGQVPRPQMHLQSPQRYRAGSSPHKALPPLTRQVPLFLRFLFSSRHPRVFFLPGSPLFFSFYMTATATRELPCFFIGNTFVPPTNVKEPSPLFGTEFRAGS